jgi:hypothetical protein
LQCRNRPYCTRRRHVEATNLEENSIKCAAREQRLLQRNRSKPDAARFTAIALHNASYACAAAITGITRDQHVAMQNPNREINANMS